MRDLGDLASTEGVRGNDESNGATIIPPPVACSIFRWPGAFSSRRREGNRSRCQQEVSNRC